MNLRPERRYRGEGGPSHPHVNHMVHASPEFPQSNLERMLSVLPFLLPSASFCVNPSSWIPAVASLVISVLLCP